MARFGQGFLGDFLLLFLSDLVSRVVNILFADEDDRDNYSVRGWMFVNGYRDIDCVAREVKGKSCLQNEKI